MMLAFNSKEAAELQVLHELRTGKYNGAAAKKQVQSAQGGEEGEAGASSTQAAGTEENKKE